jgi:hypothetical protein
MTGDGGDLELSCGLRAFATAVAAS